jgi:hypothetical protein
LSFTEEGRVVGEVSEAAESGGVGFWGLSKSGLIFGVVERRKQVGFFF